jgi:hypothetical protein
MTSKTTALERAAAELVQLKGRTIGVISLGKPQDLPEAIHLAKIVSKLTPMIGNLLEDAIVRQLNALGGWPPKTKWARQDPGFPDTILQGFQPPPPPGIEIKGWFPLSTEITGRFRESQNNLRGNNVQLAVICWIPEFLIFGAPKIIDAWVDDALAVAQSRDRHYHNPPDYVVLEPEDTTARTRNLQQTICNGHKFQGTSAQSREAETFVASWGNEARTYDTRPAYQANLRQLVGRYPYRLDTNFAKIDRIQHEGLELFKSKILGTAIHDRTVQQWQALITSENRQAFEEILALG